MEIDSIHFYVTDAINTSNWFINCLEFKLVDRYRNDDTLTIAIARKTILFVISSPLNYHSTVAYYLNYYAEGIVDITFRVNRLQKIIDRSQNFGKKILQPVRQQGIIKYARIRGWGCLQHSLIESQNKFNCYLLPNGKLKSFKANRQKQKETFNLTNIDHLVLNVARGKLKQAVNYYQSLFDFQIQQTFKINTQRSGLFSQALIDREGKVQFNINEPTTTNSQIQEFIELNGGAGIQHLALKSENLIQDISKMRSLRKVSFIPTPPSYYDRLQQRLQRDSIQFSPQQLQSITRQQILIDWQKDRFQSLLLQIFTRPILKKPTFFLEFIERRQQATGFGEGNFHALFTAVEREQINRNSDRY